MNGPLHSGVVITGAGVLTPLGVSLGAIGGPIFLALLVAGLGHFVRLFALDVASRA